MIRAFHRGRRRGMSEGAITALVVVLGLIAVVLIRQVWARGERATVAEMVTDLQSFALHQESYHRDRAVVLSARVSLINKIVYLFINFLSGIFTVIFCLHHIFT